MKAQRLIKRIPLQPGERIQLVVRQWAPALWGQWLVAAIAFFLPFFLLFPLLTWQRWGPILFGILMIIGLWVAARRIIRWQNTALIITTRQLVDADRQGLFSQVISETPRDTVADVHVEQHGLWQTMFKYGTLIYQSADSGQRIRFGPVKRPEQLAARLQADTPAQTAAPSAGVVTVQSPEELATALLAVKEQIGAAAFRKLLSKVDPGYRAYRKAKRLARSQQADSDA